jgi:zinc transport system substrate-binding protein
MRRIGILSLFLSGLMWAMCLTGCGLTGGDGKDRGMGAEGRKNQVNEERLRVVTTLFPYYDFARQVAGGQTELTLVVPAGMDSHSFEPTPADMRTIQNADILICNGGAMEHWLTQVLKASDTSQMTVVTMMDYVDITEEEHVEGMEEEHVDHDGHEMEIEYDEHIWTSPVNAVRMTEVIRDVLSQQDPKHREDYERQADKYIKELERIHQELSQVSKERRRNLIVVGEKFPFRYLAEEYDLDYRAAFSGCSTDTEPSARTIAYLIDKVKQEQIPVIYYPELCSSRVAEIIGEETGAQPLLLHSCHNVTRAQFEAGVTYVELMEQNIENLRKGLDE